MIREKRRHKKLDQATRIIKILERAGQKGVPNYFFPQHMRIMRYNARIAELRKDGYPIVTEREIVRGRHTGVFYYSLVKG